MMPITTRATDIDGTFGCINGDHPVAHRLRSGGNFHHSLAARGERNEERLYFIFGGACIKDVRKGLCSLIMVKQMLWVGQGTERVHALSFTAIPAMRIKLASIA